MAASGRLSCCLLLTLMVAGCRTAPVRWSDLWREAGPSAESQSPALGGHSQQSGSPVAPIDEFNEQAISPGVAEESESATPPTRAVALSGYIDIPTESATPATSGSDDSAETSDPVVATVDPGAESLADVEGGQEATGAASPWGLPRIPDVWEMSRRSEESSPTAWTWGLGERLLPDSQVEEPAVADVPVQTASAPETLTDDAIIWGAPSAYSQEELSKLISLIEAELTNAAPATESQRRDYLRRHALLRHLYLLAGRPHDAQQAIPGVDPADQEFWSEMYWAMSSYFDEEMLPSRSDRAAQTVARLSSAQRALEPLVPLEIRNLQFCRQINGFGNYESFGIDEFTPGQALLLYTEVRHFESEPDPSGVYRTLLESEIEIYSDTPSRELIDRTVFPATEDLCRSRRDDYFHSYRIDLPSTLAPGAYVLQLTVMDRLAGKSATESRKFFVVPATRIQ